METIPLVGNLLFKYKLNLHHFFSLFYLSINLSVLDLLLNLGLEEEEHCCGSGSAWIPHQIYKLYPDPHQFSDDKPKCMEYEYNPI